MPPVRKGARSEHRADRPDPELPPPPGRGRGHADRRARGPRPARPQRRGQDVAAPHARHGPAAVLRPAPAARPGPKEPRRPPGDQAQARLPAAEPRLLPGVHRGRVRRVLRAAQGDAVRPDPERGRVRGRTGRPRGQGEGPAAHAVRRHAAPGGDRAGDRERPAAAAARRADRGPGPRAAGGVPRAAARPGRTRDRRRVHAPGRGRGRGVLGGGADGRGPDRVPRHAGRADRPRPGSRRRRRPARARLQRGPRGGPVMTATTLPTRPARAAARAAVPPAAGRLLWIEVKRNAVPWVLPLLALLVYLDTYRTVSGYPPVWTVRAMAVPDRLLVDFAAFAGGFCAWAGSREGRRKTGDLLGTTARPAWARQLAALAGTMFWLVLAFLVAVAGLYIQIARAVTWGGPPLWPVAVGVVALVTICVVGFTAGALFPGRFQSDVVL